MNFKREFMRLIFLMIIFRTFIIKMYQGNCKSLLANIFFLIEFIKNVCTYKPVILIPGILSKTSHMNGLRDMILEAHPGTNVTTIDLYPEIESFVPLDNQLSLWREKLVQIMKDSPDGVHLVCHSQGGLICQGVIETSDHNVDTFIALSSPLNGQFGVPEIILQYLPWLRGYLREDVSKYMYKKLAQLTISFSNYWRDPRDEFQENYLNSSHYLPMVVGNNKSPRVKTEESQKHKENYLKLKKVILVGGPDDDVIRPWQSSLYGYYDNNYRMLNYTDEPVYKEDWFGLKALDKSERLHMYTFPGVEHAAWHDNVTVFKTAIEPWLV